MRAHSIDDVIGLNSMALLAASIVAQPVEDSRKQPSTEIFRPQSAEKAVPKADKSPPASTASPPAIPNFWLELHRYVSVVRKP
jgi:hypothetical protein